MNEYRYEVPASVCLSVMAASHTEAQEKARLFCETIIDGVDVDDGGEAHDVRLYVGDDAGKFPLELIDMIEDVEHAD